MALIVGTAGHIDHGKTALVRALTGQETDRLPEERARGISIDLGFAWFDGPEAARAGIVDVPGHERFIRNMLAGAHGMDLVLFTVAADDGVMPQTEEHLDILHLLGVRRGIFVITKIDLVDATRVAAVREEIEILSLGTTLEGAPIVPVSSVTGAGLDTLTALLRRELSAPPAGDGWPGRFRMPIDRAFVMHGHGLVVTGTAVAGRVGEGDTVRLLPGGETGRVRTVETHGVEVRSAGRRQRIALNLAGVDRALVGRGHVVCDPGLARVTQRFDAFVEVRPGARRALAHHGRVRVHVGTAEVLGKVVLLDRRARLEPGGRTWAQLVLGAPVLALRGDRFILRDETARWTLAGGVVVHPFADRHRAGDDALPALAALQTGDDAAAAVAFVRLAPEFAVGVDTVAHALDLDAERSAAALTRAGGLVALPEAAPEAWTTAEKWDRFAATALARIRELHGRDPLAPGLDLESLRTQLPWEVPLRIFRWSVERLVGQGVLAKADNVVRLPEHRVRLDREGGALGERLERLLAAAGLTPPDLRQLEAAAEASRKEVLDVLGVLEKERRVVRVAPELYYHPAAVAEGTRQIGEYCAAHGEITAAAFRDLIGASRKFAIAFLDWTDRTGVTLRVGDVRRLRRR